MNFFFEIGALVQTPRSALWVISLLELVEYSCLAVTVGVGAMAFRAEAEQIQKAALISAGVLVVLGLGVSVWGIVELALDENEVEADRQE